MILVYDSSYSLIATHGRPSGMAYNNLVDMVYDTDTGTWYGLDASGEGGTGTASSYIVRFEMGGSVLESYYVSRSMDGIGTWACD
jgi:hypothetical protein